ncbi:MAG TPA: T9SS type A sorting domain-containing protein [Bacteroidales bacterium]|jgi:hypothetical protein|nr:T9SS type A sorting domain-containing protein [Bacteroidales bacterium]
MKTLVAILFFTVVIVLMAKPACAQSGTHAAGLEATGSSGKVSASVGQLFTQTPSSPSAYMVEGVQQPYEIMVYTSSETLISSSQTILVFPNPFTDDLTLKISQATAGDWKYVLSDMNGKILQKDAVSADETQVQAASLPHGAYLLTVMKKNNSVRTFKIIKN